MEMPELVWGEYHFKDPDGGKIIFWPHIPCLRMPTKLRSHSNLNSFFDLFNRSKILDY